MNMFDKFVQHRKQIEEKVKEEIGKRKRSPFKVSIVGQTGVGKSSLINALFGTDLPTDPVKPCTKRVEKPIVIKGSEQQELWFYDLPGIGESEDADAQYLIEYGHVLLESDVVLWAIHTDSRSVTFDRNALRDILKVYPQQDQSHLISKITFVLTKADTICITPWVLAKSGEHGSFAPSSSTRDILERKAAYFQEAFLHPYKEFFVSKTFRHQGEIFDIDDPRFIYDDYSITYRGFLDNSTLTQLRSKYSQYESVFNRLYDNCQVIPCSARFRYNLARLLLVIVNKLGRDAIFRFDNFKVRQLRPSFF